jgi:hypothetical protein
MLTSGELGMLLTMVMLLDVTGLLDASWSAAVMVTETT